MPYVVHLDWGIDKYFHSHTKARMYLFRTYVADCDKSHEDDVRIAAAWRDMMETDAIDCFGAIYPFEFEDDGYED